MPGTLRLSAFSAEETRRKVCGGKKAQRPAPGPRSDPRGRAPGFKGPCFWAVASLPGLCYVINTDALLLTRSTGTPIDRVARHLLK